MDNPALKGEVSRIKVKSKFMNSVLGGLIFIALTSGCATAKYSKMLEEIIKTEHSFVSQSHEQTRKEFEKTYAFNYSKMSLEIDKERKINLEIYNSDNNFSNIILIPSVGEPASSLDKFSRKIALYGHNVFALDIEGFGKSTGKRGVIDMKKVEEDISKTIELVREQNTKKIILAGTSIGAEFSLLYSVEGKHKDLVDALVVQGVCAPCLNFYFDKREWFCKKKAGSFFVELFAGEKMDILYHLGRNNFYNDEGKLAEILNEPNYETQIDTESYLNFLSYKPKNSLTCFDKPVLFIVAKDDRMIPFKHSMKVYNHLKKNNPNNILYVPRGEENNGMVPHMAFDVNYRKICSDINKFIKYLVRE